MKTLVITSGSKKIVFTSMKIEACKAFIEFGPGHLPFLQSSGKKSHSISFLFHSDPLPSFHTDESLSHQ